MSGGTLESEIFGLLVTEKTRPSWVTQARAAAGASFRHSRRHCALSAALKAVWPGTLGSFDPLWSGSSAQEPDVKNLLSASYDADKRCS